MATKARKDSRGYALKKGESQRKDGRYVFRYTTIRGEQKAVYAKELSELRKKEVKIRRAIEDGLDPDRAERITLNELFDEYISQKYDLKQSTLTNYKYIQPLCPWRFRETAHQQDQIYGCEEVLLLPDHGKRL